MVDTHFKIVFEGQLRDGVEPETARLNLAALFKSEVSAVEKLFSGQPIALKRGLSHSEAQLYLNALHDAGVEARIESDPAISLSLNEVEEPRPYVAPFQPTISTSPYAPPRAQVSDVLPDYSELRVFSVQGRIGRLRYLAWSLVLMVAGLAAAAFCASIMMASLVGGGLCATVAAVAFLIISIQIGVQRLHDVGWSGWLLLLNVIPVVGTVFPILMVVVPGNTGANQFGPPSPPNNRSVKVLATLWPVLLLIVGMGMFFNGLTAFEDEVDATATEYENALPYDDDQDGDAAQPSEESRHIQSSGADVQEEDL